MLYIATIFASIFLAELGDKTQLATLLFASEGRTHPLLVFCAAAAALCLSSAIAVMRGAYASRYLEFIPLKLLAGLGFIAIGAWTLIDHARG